VTITVSLAISSRRAWSRLHEKNVLPRGIGVARLCGMPVKRFRQHQTLGLSL
jgi:hypothetical protein